MKAICDTCSMHANMDEGTRQKNMKTIAAFLVQVRVCEEALLKL